MYSVICILIIGALIAADQLVKLAVVGSMELNQSVVAIKGVLNWTYILNDGASWGIFGGKTAFLVIVTGIVMAVLAYVLFSKKFKHWTGNAALMLVLAGGVGNMIDRLFNDGHVVDFIDIDPLIEPLFTFPKFNIADMCVTVGGALLCVFILFFFEKDKKSSSDKADDTALDG